MTEKPDSSEPDADVEKRKPIGITPTGGPLTLSGFKLSIGPDGPKVEGSILLGSSMWLHWGLIAAEHEGRAWEARRELVRRWGEPKAGNLMSPEMHATMVTVTSAALAIEALHADLAPKVGRDWDLRRHRGKSWGYMLGTFQQANPDRASNWHGPMSRLTDLRNEAIHARTVSRQSVLHPAVPTGVAEEVVKFRCEVATSAVDFLVHVFEAVLLPDTKTGIDPAWGKPAPHVIEQVNAVRPVVDGRP